MNKSTSQNSDLDFMRTLRGKESEKRADEATNLELRTAAFQRDLHFKKPHDGRAL